VHDPFNRATGEPDEPDEPEKNVGQNIVCARTSAPLNEHIAESGVVVFRHACKLGFEGIVSKRLGSRYTSGRTRNWLKMKNSAGPAVKREAEEDWGGRHWR
jgi:ATP-dependent DNA ligase